MRQRRKSEKFKEHEGLSQLVLTLKTVTKQSVEIENNLQACSKQRNKYLVLNITEVSLMEPPLQISKQISPLTCETLSSGIICIILCQP